MPEDFLQFICHAFNITLDDLVMEGRYLNLQDLIKLPNPKGKELEQPPPYLLCEFRIWIKWDLCFAP